MRLRWYAALALTALPGAVAPAAAQSPAPQPVLSLEDALALARKNNPDYQQTRNNLRPAEAGVKNAYLSFLPSVDASFDNQFRQGGQQLFNGAALGASSDIIQSSWSLDLAMRLNTATLINPRLQRANRAAVEADIAGAGELLRADVARQYLTVLQADARAALADTLVTSAQIQLQNAQARAAAGAATTIDVRRAEVALGQAQVDALSAHNTVEVEKLRLFQLLGVPQPANVQLTTEFPVSAPTLGLDSLLELARKQNPILGALRSRERAAGLGYRRRRASTRPR
jgi:outer membrane protein TolC